jgi:hypothetical protein
MDLMYIIVLILIIVIVNVIVISMPLTREKYQNYLPYKVNYGRGYNLTFPLNLNPSNQTRMSDRAVVSNNISTQPSSYNCPTNINEGNAKINDATLNYILKVACFRLKLSEMPRVDKKNVTVKFDTSKTNTETIESLFKMIACNPFYVEFVHKDIPSIVTRPYLIKYVNNKNNTFDHLIHITNKPKTPVTTVLFEAVDDLETVDLSRHTRMYKNNEMLNVDYINIRAYYLDVDLGNFQQNLLTFTMAENQKIKNLGLVIYDKKYQNSTPDKQPFYYFMQQMDYFLRQNTVAPPITINCDLPITQDIISHDRNIWFPFMYVVNNELKLLFILRFKINTDASILSIDIIAKNKILQSFGNQNTFFNFKTLQTSQEDSIWIDVPLDSTNVQNYNITFTISSKQTIIKVKNKDMISYSKSYMSAMSNYIDAFYKEKNTTEKLAIISMASVNYLRQGYENYIV